MSIRSSGERSSIGIYHDAANRLKTRIRWRTLPVNEKKKAWSCPGCGAHIRPPSTVTVCRYIDREQTPLTTSEEFYQRLHTRTKCPCDKCDLVFIPFGLHSLPSQRLNWSLTALHLNFPGKIDWLGARKPGSPPSRSTPLHATTTLWGRYNIAIISACAPVIGF